MITNSIRVAIRSNVNSLKLSNFQDSSFLICRAISTQSTPLSSDVSSKLKTSDSKTQTVFQPAVGGSESTQTTVFTPYSGERHIVQDESVFKPSHTGQVWHEQDYRNSRFVGMFRQINPRFAIDLVNSVPPKMVSERVVVCDGGHGALGHPRIYINLDKPGAHACGYCGLRFELKGHDENAKSH
jgi:NADH dehydrogenase (ubiquinone) Fe-S protein 6